MPVPMNPSSVYEFLVKGIADGQQILNATHWKLQDASFTPGSEPTMEEVILLLRDRWDDLIASKTHNIYDVEVMEFREITGRVVLDPVPPPPAPPHALTFGALVTAITNLFGVIQRDGPTLPTFVAIGVRKTSTNATRAGRGSMRIGPLSETDTVETDGARLEAAYHGTVSVDVAAFFTPLAVPAPRTAIIDPVVFARTTYLKAAAGPLAPSSHGFNVLSTSVSPLVTSQVSRKRRVGGN